MRLTKRNVEALLDRYDIDPIGALTTALRRVLEMPDASWDELLLAGPFTDAQGTPDSLYQLRAVDERGQTSALTPPQPVAKP